jgi:hypothetical protein
MNISKLKINQQVIQVGRLSKKLAEFAEKEKYFEDFRIRTIENIIDGVVYLDGYLEDIGSYEQSDNQERLYTYSISTGENLFEDKNTDWELYSIKNVFIENNEATIISSSYESITLNKDELCEQLTDMTDRLDEVSNTLTRVLNNFPDNPPTIKFELLKENNENNTAKNKAYYKTDKKEISLMQAKMNAITNNMSPKERENLREIFDWCEKENTSITQYLSAHERNKNERNN